MKKKIFLFSVALLVLMFVNIRFSFFSGTDSELTLMFNQSEINASIYPGEGGGGHIRCACRKNNCRARFIFGSRCAIDTDECWHSWKNCK